MKLKYPYENLSLANERGEKWKDIKGYEGRYQVSSHGRIKCRERTLKFPRVSPVGIITTTPARIKSQKIIIKQNDYAGSPVYQCTISFRKEGKERTFKINRLVYEHFVGKIPAGKDILICQKDGNGRNNHYRNLVPMTLSEITRRAIKLGRKRNPYSLLSTKTLKHIYRLISISKCVPVQRISPTGRVLKNYNSIADAAAAVPCDRSYLTLILKGRKEHVKGWRFRYADAGKR